MTEQDLTVYLYNENFIFSGEGKATIGPKFNDKRLPANSTEINPESVFQLEENQVYFYSLDLIPHTWIAKYDYYSKVYYSIDTKQVLAPIYSDIELTDRTSLNPNEFIHPEWDGNKWVENNEKLICDSKEVKKQEAKSTLTSLSYGVAYIKIDALKSYADCTFNITEDTFNYAANCFNLSIDCTLYCQEVTGERKAVIINNQDDLKSISVAVSNYQNDLNAQYVSIRNEIEQATDYDILKDYKIEFNVDKSIIEMV